MVDSHIHSNFSTDSNALPESICKYAMASGLKGIAITDHNDYDFPRATAASLIDFDKYFAKMKALKERYEGKLEITVGVEVGIQPHTIASSSELLRRYPFEFVIGSIHIIDGMDPYELDYYRGVPMKEAYGRYLECIDHMVTHFSDFDVLGHIDYIARCSSYSNKMLRYCDYSDLIDSIFGKLIQRGKGIEFNTKSYRREYGAWAAAPDPALYQRYRELGGEILTLGSDSHEADQLAYDFRLHLPMLINAGFTHIAYFKDRKPIFERIEDLF